MSAYPPDVQVHVAIVERCLRVAMKGAFDDMRRRLSHCDATMEAHRSAGRGIEAAACAIRAQVLREAIAVLEDKAIGALRAYVRNGRYSAADRAS